MNKSNQFLVPCLDYSILLERDDHELIMIPYFVHT